MKQNFELRKELIDKDLNINLEKLNIDPEENTENQSKNEMNTSDI